MKVIMDIDKDGVKPGESRRFTLQELVRDAKAVGLTKSDAKPKAFEPQSDGSLLVRFEVGHLSAEMRVERGDWKEDAGGASLAH
jgi:hypothetical protein